MHIGKHILAVVFAASVVRAASAGEPSPVQIVAQLYRDFAWEAVIDSPDWSGHHLLDQPLAVLEQYFEPRLAALIVSDRECVVRTEQICELDFSPIWASQDPGASAMKITPGPSPNLVEVRFRYPGDGTKVELSYRMSKTARGWRIADIRHRDWTLLSALSRPR